MRTGRHSTLFTIPTTLVPRPPSRLGTTKALENTNGREKVGEMDDQLWWLNRPVCLEWPEKADETSNALPWLVELVRKRLDALVLRRAPKVRANRRSR
jgi:hypothetical protein